MRRLTCVRWLGLGLCLLIAGCIWLDVETINTYKNPPAPKADRELKDDLPEEKPATPFDPALVDRRPLDGWLFNSSAAVQKLDVPASKPDEDRDMRVLHRSYADACKAAKHDRSGEVILPSVNLLDGKAKQFDDGLYAAVDLAYYRGLREHLTSHVRLIERMYTQLKPDSQAAAFLAAGLSLARVEGALSVHMYRANWLQQFYRNEARSKPAGFYTWSADLKTCFQFLRFFQHEFASSDLEVPAALATVLDRDPKLKADYVRAVDFYRKLSNPYECHDLTEIHNLTPQTEAHLPEYDKPPKKTARSTVAVFPSSGSKENALFAKLFPMGLPPDANLMDALVRQIRGGAIDLRPGPDSGWYDHQVYALETMLLPGKGEENAKLLLTRRYKKRMLEAFQALITKRRETHLRQASPFMAMSAIRPLELPKKVSPRLRVEPCPSYYVRTARAYSFLFNFLESAIGKEGLQSIHGLREGKPQAIDLHAELVRQRDLFYGLYLVSCEDIGLKPAFLKDEHVDQEGCYKLACDWLPTALDDPDMTRDTRVAVPIYHDPVRKVTRLWTTMGVRLAHLEASYVHPPHLKPEDGGDWRPVESHRLGESKYLICVDEFAEVEIRGLQPLTREEFRKVCDRHRNKDAIITALKRR
jgi:hypothetical protein